MRQILEFLIRCWKDTATSCQMWWCHQMGSLPCPGPGTKPSGFGILVRKSNFYLKLQDLEKVFVHVDILVRKICLPLVKLPICDKSGFRFMHYYKLSLHVRDILPVHKFPNTVTQCNFRAPPQIYLWAYSLDGQWYKGFRYDCNSYCLSWVSVCQILVSESAALQNQGLAYWIKQ